MATVVSDQRETLADVLARLGGIDPARVRFHPPPGTATEEDVIAIQQRENRLCELVDGVLVEKVMGLRESILAVAIASALRVFVKPRKLGIVAGADGTLKLFPGLVRIPDVSFATWDRLPGRRVPDEPIPPVAPDLAVEVISAGNTPAEMARKLQEYTAAGTNVVWMIYPDDRTAVIHRAGGPTERRYETDSLDGEGPLEGFSISLGELFAELDLHG